MFSHRYFGAALLAAVLTGSLLLTLLAGFVLSTAAGIGAEKPPVEPAPIPHLSDNLRGELNSAYAPEFPFNFDAASNPFADKSGVSVTAGSSAAAAAGSSALPPPPVAGGFSLRPNGAGIPPGLYPAPSPISGAGGRLPQPPPLLSAEAAAPPVADLLKERQRSIKLGRNVAPLASFFSIDDLRPYGIVGSGDNNRVKLFAPSTKDRFSVARGTRFRDGTIISFSDESVSYRRDNGEVTLKRWMKNLQTAPSANQPDAPVIRLDQP